MSYMKRLVCTQIWADTFCPGCGAIDPECNWEDFGIGAYEYWGFTGFDSHLEFVTRCCEAPPEKFWPDPVEPNANLLYEHEVV